MVTVGLFNSSVKNVILLVLETNKPWYVWPVSSVSALPKRSRPLFLSFNTKVKFALSLFVFINLTIFKLFIWLIASSTMFCCLFDNLLSLYVRVVFAQRWSNKLYLFNMLSVKLLIC